MHRAIEGRGPQYLRLGSRIAFTPGIEGREPHYLWAIYGPSVADRPSACTENVLHCQGPSLHHTDVQREPSPTHMCGNVHHRGGCGVGEVYRCTTLGIPLLFACGMSRHQRVATVEATTTYGMAYHRQSKGISSRSIGQESAKKALNAAIPFKIRHPMSTKPQVDAHISR